MNLWYNHLLNHPKLFNLKHRYKTNMTLESDQGDCNTNKISDITSVNKLDPGKEDMDHSGYVNMEGKPVLETIKETCSHLFNSAFSFFSCGLGSVQSSAETNWFAVTTDAASVQESEPLPAKTGNEKEAPPPTTLLVSTSHGPNVNLLESVREDGEIQFVEKASSNSGLRKRKTTRCGVKKPIKFECGPSVSGSTVAKISVSNFQ